MNKKIQKFQIKVYFIQKFQGKQINLGTKHILLKKNKESKWSVAVLQAKIILKNGSNLPSQGKN